MVGWTLTSRLDGGNTSERYTNGLAPCPLAWGTSITNFTVKVAFISAFHPWDSNHLSTNFPLKIAVITLEIAVISKFHA